MKKILLISSLIISYFITSIITTKLVYAQNDGYSCAGSLCYQCQAAAVKKAASGGQNWDLSYCITANTPQQLQRISQITAKCRKAPGFIVTDKLFDGQNCECHQDVTDSNNPLFFLFLAPVCGAADILEVRENVKTQTQSVNNTPPILQDPETGKYYTCYTFTELDRNMGAIELQFEDAEGNILCEASQIDVEVKNYSWSEYLDNTLEATFGLDIITDPTERSPKDLFCSTVEGKGSDADNPGVINLLTGITTPAINTALGCIATDLEGFSKDFLTLAIGIGGPIALLLLLYAFFTIATAAGNPTKVQQGQQIISSVIQGLVIIALSVVLLNLLGINILGLPGLQ